MKKAFIKAVYLFFMIATSICVSAESIPADQAYKFMIDGWGGDALRGVQKSKDFRNFFDGVGKVVKKKVEYINNANYPKIKDEVHYYYYDGMSVVVYVSNVSKKIIISDVVITSPIWPVMYGLNVGVSRSEVERHLGMTMYAEQKNKWIYADGMDEVSFEFDKNNKVKSIHWNVEVD